MRIRLNEEEYSLAEGSTVTALLDALKLDTRKVAVEVNLTVIPRSLHDATALNEGDAVEIVRFIGGG